MQTEFRAGITTSSGFNEEFFFTAVDVAIPGNVQWVTASPTFGRRSSPGRMQSVTCSPSTTTPSGTHSVCIAVCGGTAFSCTHLPDGASNIYLSVWSSRTESGRPGNNNNMESVTWRWDSRHRHYAYPVWLNETTPHNSVPRDRQYDYGMRWKYNLGFWLHTGDGAARAAAQRRAHAVAMAHV